MEEFWVFIFILFFATNSLDKAESVQLFDEIFGEGWWDNDKAEEWHKLTLEHNFHHQLDRQNTQIGQIEPNSNDQLGQIQPNSTDQNPPLTESDHSDNAKNGEEQKEIMKVISLNKNIAEDERKHKIVAKFHEIKDEFKQKGKFPYKERVQIEVKIAKDLKVSRKKIYEWKKEFGLTRINPKNKRKNLIENFDQMKAELKRAGIKNSYPNQINKTVSKEFCLSFTTIYEWKRELGQTAPNKHYHSKQKELMKIYYEIKAKNSKISDEKIAKMLKVGLRTLYRWKHQFKRQHLHPNSVDVHYVEENAAANVQIF